ncbi:MAG: helicase-related protein [Anaerolineae bacterium]
MDNWRTRDRDLVLVDESQNFRHGDTQRYAALQIFTQTRPTILLTATPRATSAWDIYHQIKLWHPQDTTDTDIALLEEMARLVEPIGPQEDNKLQQLIAMLTHGRTLSDDHSLPGDLAHSKVLIFTQYADTAHYLYDNLRHLGRIRAVESDTKGRGRVILRFAPQANNYELQPSDEDLRILVATDVLSEGLNLQDANHIINYDLHWNPIRLIQRVGRVDRIGTEHTTIYAYNFLPETGLERELGIERRLEHRITEIHHTIGEDAPILHRSERVNKEAMYAIYRGDPSVLEDEPKADIFNLLEAEELMRQLQPRAQHFASQQGHRSGIGRATSAHCPRLQPGGSLPRCLRPGRRSRPDPTHRLQRGITLSWTVWINCCHWKHF